MDSSAEGTERFDQSGSQTGHQADLLAAGHGIGFAETLIQDCQFDAQHHQKFKSEKSHGVDAVRMPGANLPLLISRQGFGLPGVGQIAQNNTYASGWKYPPEQQRVRESENAAKQTNDQKDLNQVVESQSQQAINIASQDANSGLGSMAHPVFV